jgi:F-type H+-transporting ATPase subunit b
MLKIDYTLFVQIANFLFLLIILNLILYRPIRTFCAKGGLKWNPLRRD